jgi:hypothetical protein
VKASSARLADEKALASAEKGRVERAEAQLRDLKRELDAAHKARGEEETASKALRADLARRSQELALLNKSLDDLRTPSAGLRQALAARDAELAAAKAFREKWVAAEDRARLLEKSVRAGEQELAGARQTVATLQGEVGKARAVAESRFAGITLTGRRVIFLVDMSGSMELVDENTPSPEKWLEVRNTVLQLMRSLGNLEKFQVITFSSKIGFPLGKEGEWLDAKVPPAEVGKVLTAIKPKGGTNMHLALEAAFRYRTQGLDTVYLLSDGLPNLGPGLDRPSRELSEVERGTILGKFVRKVLRENWNRPLPGQARVRINTVGFFYESPDLGAFLWALSRENDGSFVGMSKP